MVCGWLGGEQRTESARKGDGCWCEQEGVKEKKKWGFFIEDGVGMGIKDNG